MRPLADIPRVKLLAGRTPLLPLVRLTEALGHDCPTLWIKRDDLTPLVLGGNKLRKLEYLIAAAMAEGADTVITSGAVQSNHACQTAAAAARHGLSAVLLLAGEENAELQGNLRLDRIYGAELRIKKKLEPGWPEEVAAELRGKGKKPYVIPYGGSNALGILGYARAGGELAAQLAELDLELDEIVVSSSSGGTQAGLLLARAGGILEVPVLGISADLDAAKLRRRIAELASQSALQFDLAAPDEDDIATDDAYLGPGYGVPGESTLEAIRLFARTEGLLADPVYTGKALSGLIALARSGRWPREANVLFWHTGGLPAIFASRDLP